MLCLQHASQQIKQLEYEHTVKVKELQEKNLHKIHVLELEWRKVMLYSAPTYVRITSHVTNNCMY